MKKIIIYLCLFPALSSADYVAGDGTLDLVCSDKNITAQPYNVFDLTLMYDDSKNPFDIISDEGLSSGNGDVIYQVKVAQFATYRSEFLPSNQEIQGCEFAPLIFKAEQNDASNISFKCKDDSSGQLTIDADMGSIEGLFTFSESKTDLEYPIVRNTSFEITCTFK